MCDRGHRMRRCALSVGASHLVDRLVCRGDVLGGEVGFDIFLAQLCAVRVQPDQIGDQGVADSE